MTFYEIAMRVGAACIAGFIFGIERERRGRAAGLRTTIIVCIAAALAAILPDILYGQQDHLHPSGWRPDPMRLGAGMFAGIGFLGAGTIIRQGSVVRGVTTAAVLWFVTMVGLCFGSGAFQLGILGSAFALFAVCLLPVVERRLKFCHYATLTLIYSNRICSTEPFRHALTLRSVHVRSSSLCARVGDEKCKAVFRLRYCQDRSAQPMPEEIVPFLATLPGVIEIEWNGEN